MSRYQDTFSDAFGICWDIVPPEPLPNRPSQTAQTPCPEPGAFTLVPLSAPFALRCSANTLSAGRRCRNQAYYPATLCDVRVTYRKRHGHLPLGGATRPYVPHPDDYWPAFKPRPE